MALSKPGSGKTLLSIDPVIKTFVGSSAASRVALAEAKAKASECFLAGLHKASWQAALSATTDG